MEHLKYGALCQLWYIVLRNEISMYIVSGAVRGRQGPPGAARGRQGPPGAARGRQGPPGAIF